MSGDLKNFSYGIIYCLNFPYNWEEQNSKFADKNK